MKNKNTVVIVMFALAIFIGLAIYAKPGTGENKEITTEETANSYMATERSALIAEETFYDFGTIQMNNGKVSRVFNIKNTGTEDILLERVTTSCMCTVAYIVNGENKKGPFGMPGHGGLVPKANYTIKAGEAVVIEAVFDPNAHGPAGVGLIERVVQLEYNNGTILGLNFKAIVTP